MQVREEKEVKIYHVEGVESGVHFTVFGGVHGNEKCGPQALARIAQNIEDGTIKITHGSFTFVPIANPKAYEQNVRFTARNLNRSLYPKTGDEVVCYEDEIGNILCPILEDTDYLLDLHSCTSRSEAFLIIGGGENTRDFANKLGVPRVISGWHEAVSVNPDVPDARHSWGTTEYAREHGATAITLECGNHDHPRAADAGYQAVINALIALGIAQVQDSLNISDIFAGETYDIHIKGMFFKTCEGALTQDWTNMHPVAKGQAVAQFNDGKTITMPEDGFIVLPNKNAVIGAEWFFWGVVL